MTDQRSGTAALIKHRTDVAASKRLHVVEAIGLIESNGDQITVAAVARKADVSREFIYSHPELREAIDKAKDRVARQIPDIATSSGREKSLRSERDTLLRRVERDKTALAASRIQLDELERQRQVWLGAQLAALTDAPAQELRVENDRLNQRVFEMSRELESLHPVIAGLREELRISRSAHAQALLDGDARHDNVTLIRPENPLR